MKTWFDFYKRGMSQPMPEDPIGDKQNLSLPPGPVPSTRQRLKNLLPFVKRHWRKGMIGALLILFTSLLGFPGPLITRYVVDKVIIDKQLALLSGAIILLGAIKITSMLAGAMQKYYFSRFEQEVLLDIQQHLLDRTLRFPKSFFDSQEVGYLMSRLLNDVGGLRMFFSSTLVYIVSSFFRFLGGTALLFYLNWQLALVVCGALPVMVLIVRFFAKKIQHYR